MTTYANTMPAASTMPAQYTGGVVPIGVEPLHQMEKNALTVSGYQGGGGMATALDYLKQMTANPSQFATQYTNPLATQYMGQAGQATQTGMAAITPDEVFSMQNPFSDALKSRLSEAGEKARAAILANQGTRGARSFADNRQGIRESNLDTQMLMGEGDIDYKTFQDALGIVQNGRNRSLQGGAQLGSLGTQAQGITNSAMQTGLSGIGALFNAGLQQTQQNFQNQDRAARAGGFIRNYNQGINDMAVNDIMGEQGFDASKVSQILGWLKEYQSKTSGGSSGANSLQTMSNLLTMGGGLADAASLWSTGEDVEDRIEANPGGIFSSDIRLKENIVPVGSVEGFPVYEFSYKGFPDRYRGVMAQDVLELKPEAVQEIDGYLAVDYRQLPVQFSKAAGGN